MMPPIHIGNYVLAYVIGGILWLAIVAFATSAGADFGAGVWDLLSWGSSAKTQRAAIIEAIKPIWEGNEIWSVFLVTGLFSAFPVVFSTLSVALFYPITLALLGLVMRGAGFIYYEHFSEHFSREGAKRGPWGPVFSLTSLATPFFFGAVAAAVASGEIHYRDGHIMASYITPWLTPFAVFCGLFAIGICSVLAAVYMTVQGLLHKQDEIIRAFRWRALASGAVTALLGAIAAALASRDAPYVWHGLTTRALPFALAGVLIGALTAAALLLNHYRTARLLVGGEVLMILLAWGIAQFPYFIVPDLSVESTASPPQVQLTVLITALLGLAFVLPAYFFLLHVFEGRERPPATTAEQWSESEGNFNLQVVLGLAQVGSPKPAPVRRAAHQALAQGEHAVAARTVRSLPTLALSATVVMGTLFWPALRRRFEQRAHRSHQRQPSQPRL